jgi:hypothetical protein
VTLDKDLKELEKYLTAGRLFYEIQFFDPQGKNVKNLYYHGTIEMGKKFGKKFKYMKLIIVVSVIVAAVIVVLLILFLYNKRKEKNKNEMRMIQVRPLEQTFN